MVDRPNAWMSVRNDTATIRFAVQLAQVPTLTAWPRTPKGEIAESIDQNTGPNPIANERTQAIRLATAIHAGPPDTSAAQMPVPAPQS